MSSTGKRGFRYRLRQRLDRWLHKSPNSRDVSIRMSQRTKADLNDATNLASIHQKATSTIRSLSFDQENDVPGSTTNTVDEEQDQIRNTSRVDNLDQNLTLILNASTPGEDIQSIIDSSDLWSAAYREAVESFGDEIDIAILKEKNVAQLFKELEEIGTEVDQESAFLRGVKYLRSIKVPLERFKLALDLASPLTHLDPTATTVFGVVRSVTAIAISFASADLDFAKQIGEMLEQISYIDGCDTLGQKAGQKDIHKALVLVYQKILEFYKVAFEILHRKGAGMIIMKMVLENDRLPSIVQDFLKYSNALQNLIQKAMWEILEDIKTMLYEDKITKWLGKDKMIRQSQYHADLQNLLADQACEFLLTNTNFVNWYHASDSQQLVILGDMGSGKTVAMSYLVKQLIQRNECQIPRPKICYYYCRDDETGQATHIFSVLMLSLFEQLPGLIKPFFEWYREAQASGIFDPATDEKKMEEFLEKVLEAVERPVFIVIDGLDECDRVSRNNLLKLLRTLSQKIPRLKTILSSRPQEEILQELGDISKIDLGSDAQRDGMIVERAVEMQLSYLSTNVKALVTERLSLLAQGSAIWTKMVVKLIADRRITALNPMRIFLEEIPLPGQLSKLYTTLLARRTSDETENQELARTALKLLAIAHRPFSILELTWAVTLGTAQHITTVEAIDRLADYQRIMSLIDPFIARVDFDDVKKRQVRLIHQSVKEFIVKEWSSNRPRLQEPVLRETEETTISQGIESLEAFILEICIRYLLLDEIGNRNLFSEEFVAISELPQEYDLFSDNKEPVEYDRYCTWEAWEESMIHYDPIERGFGEFFIYASCYWLEHLGAITVEPLPNLANIENLCQAGSTRLHNWTKQNCRPDCAINPRFQFDGNLYDPLSIVSLYGSEAMLRKVLESSDFDEDKFLRKPAVNAADQILQWGDLSRLKILFLDDKFGWQLQNLNFFRLIIKYWSHFGPSYHNWDFAFDLVYYLLDKLMQEDWGNELLCVAASAGCMPIIQRLMTSARNNAELRDELLREFRHEEQWSSAFDKPTHQSIGEAVVADKVDVVEYLLQEDGIEAHLRYRNSRGENVLHLASRTCNPKMFSLLVPRFREGVHQADHQGYTPLVRVVMNSMNSSVQVSRDRYESVRVLLVESGTDWHNYSWDGQQDPLRTAVQLGDLDMCHLLICCRNLNPHSALVSDSENLIGLKDRTPGNKENMQQTLQLLCTHADSAASSSLGLS